MNEVLVLTVGGSPQPLRSAIEARAWDRVIFIVSDGSDGKESSRPNVEDPEIDYDKKKGLRGPGLRHVPACPKDIAIMPVPPDDLDRALALTDQVLAGVLKQGAAVTVNYTGGTKTMTVALVLAASAREGVRIEFMAGERPDLVRVRDGTEKPVEMPGHLLGLANLFSLARAEVKRRAYGAALAVVGQIEQGLRDAAGGPTKPPQGWRSRASAWAEWLRLLDAWDRFDVSGAWDRLGTAQQSNAQWAAALAQVDADRLKALADERKAGAGPLLCEDLWLNALRRADLGLYDDAIARLYRLAEAAVQARLRLCHDIPDTGAVPVARLPAALRAGCKVKPDRRTGAVVAELPLFRALELLAHLDPADPLVAVWPRDGNRFATPDWQAARNRSILAHGFRPATRADWDGAKAWFDDRRAALWETLLDRPTAPQLPDSLP
ncbi:MAG: TIGR02710 family CRISPR-associated CARF protein [Pseudomonadota bacterium]